MSGRDPWAELRRFTPARIALGRSGDGLPTARMLEFQRDHALARDAVHQPFDPERVAVNLSGIETIQVRSQAPDRAAYLQRPDLGRRLDPASARGLPPGPVEAVIVLGDGLSARAVHDHGAALVRALLDRLGGWTLGPVVLAHQARVALGDHVAAACGAAMAVMLVGERPGLSAADSLGAYLTWNPRPGRTMDSQRNCVSNIRPDGFPPDAAATLIAGLMGEARRLKLTGVELKADAALAPPPAP